MPAGFVLQSVFTESKRLSHLGYRTWYTKAKELAQSYDTDSDLISSKQAITNNIEAHYKTSWENKMQDTENCPILRPYKLFKKNFYTKVKNKFSNFCTLDDSEKFIFLMQSNDAHVITWMAKFVYQSMIKRSDILLSEVQEKDETLA